MSIKMLQNDERQARFATKQEHCIQLFGSILHKNLSLLERQTKMKLTTA